MGTGITDYINGIFNNIYEYLEELNRAIFETREMIEITKIAVFCCIGLMVLFFIITMVRISGLKQQNEDLRRDVKNLSDKINSLTGMLQGFLIASRTTSNNNTSNQSQTSIETPADDSKEIEGHPYDSQEELRRQLEKETSADESDGSGKFIIGFVIFCFVFVFVAILAATFSNMK